MTEPTRKQQTAREMADSIIAAKKAAAANQENEGWYRLFKAEMRDQLRMIDRYLTSTSEHIKTPGHMLRLIKHNTDAMMRNYPRDIDIVTGDARITALWDAFAAMHALSQSYSEGHPASAAEKTIEAARVIAEAALEA